MISSMLVGSYRNLPDQTLTFGGGTETVSASLGGIYLHHATSALSLVTQVAAAVANKEAGGTCELLESGLTRISATGVFSLTWTSTLIRDLLGFRLDGNLAAANSYTSSEISPLVWIPAMTDSPLRAVLGRSGSKRHDHHRVTAPDSTQVVRNFGSAIQTNEYRWTNIPQAYYQTTDDLGGELSKWIDEVLVLGSKFWLHRDITFDTTSTTAMTLDAQAVGPYGLNEDVNGLAEKFKRSAGLENVDKNYDFMLKVLVEEEYT